MKDSLNLADKNIIQFNEIDSAHLNGPTDAAKIANHGSIGAVISGLPLLSMPPRKVIKILGGAFFYLRHGAAFYQFTYSRECPVPRPIPDRLGLKARVSAARCQSTSSRSLQDKETRLLKLAGALLEEIGIAFPVCGAPCMAARFASSSAGQRPCLARQAANSSRLRGCVAG